MEVTHAIILAGGYGTRLKSVVNDIPKPMAAIAGRPFLEYQMDYLIDQGLHSITLCTGHLSSVIENHFGNSYRSLSISYSVEDTPLGTGGAIKKALLNYTEDQCFVLNGDSFFEIDLQMMSFQHKESKLSIALKYLNNTDRYGNVRFDDNLKISSFNEKASNDTGWINGGIYLFNKSIIKSFPDLKQFSLENFITDYVHSHTAAAFLSNGYFIDIGVPEDLSRAQFDIPHTTNAKFKGWTLFLDRDGVINVRTPGDYIKSWKEWEYTYKALEAIRRLSHCFDRIIVVTNQQGVGLGQMSHYDLSMIHHRLQNDVIDAGGYINKCYAATDLKEKENNSRKPNTTMGLWAQKDFPQIDFEKSIMVGDSASDIEFGKHLGMKTACIDGKFEDKIALEALHPDWKFESLFSFAESLDSLL